MLANSIYEYVKTNTDWETTDISELSGDRVPSGHYYRPDHLVTLEELRDQLNTEVDAITRAVDSDGRLREISFSTSTAVHPLRARHVGLSRSELNEQRQ